MSVFDFQGIAPFFEIPLFKSFAKIASILQYSIYNYIILRLFYIKINFKYLKNILRKNKNEMIFYFQDKCININYITLFKNDYLNYPK